MTLFLCIFSVPFIPDKLGTEESAVRDYILHKSSGRRQKLHLLWVVVFFSVYGYFHEKAFGITAPQGNTGWKVPPKAIWLSLLLSVGPVPSGCSVASEPLEPEQCEPWHQGSDFGRIRMRAE